MIPGDAGARPGSDAYDRRRMRRGYRVLVACVFVAGCSPASTNRAEVGAPTNDVPSARSDSAAVIDSVAPAAGLCDDGVRASPAGTCAGSDLLIPIPRSNVESYYRGMQRALDAVVASADGADLRGDLERLGAMQHAIADAVLASWGPDGADLLAAADDWGGPITRYVTARRRRGRRANRRPRRL